MFTKRTLLAAPAVFALAAAACSAETTPSESASSASQASSSCEAAYAQCGGQGFTGATCCVSGYTCTYGNQWYSQCAPSGSGSSSGGSGSSSGSPPPPPPATTDELQRGAATAAYTIMKAAASACVGLESGNFGGPCFATDILASQRYTLSGNTVVFDPSGQAVPQAAKVALAVAQLNSDLAAFLVKGLNDARANTSGHAVAVSMPIQALANFTYPGNSNPIQIVDGAAGGTRRHEVVTGSAWNNTAKVHFVDTSGLETGFAPFQVIDDSHASVTNNAALFHGSNNYPTTPFNGPGNANNPYLVVAVNGQSINWNSSNWPTQNCPNDYSCKGTIDIDPIPYTQPSAYYDTNSQLVGPQGNPFAATVTNLYADPSHSGQWATRTVGGVQQWGTFSNPVNVLGQTVYQYVKQM